MKIFTKFILILLFTSLLLLTVIYSAVQWSFDRGMLEYVNKKELIGLQLLSKNLVSFYQQAQSWESLVMSQGADRRPPPRRQDNVFALFDKEIKYRPSKKWHQIIKFSNDGIELPSDVEQYLRINANFHPKSNRPPTFPPNPNRTRPTEFPPAPDRARAAEFQQRPPQNNNQQHPSLLNADKQQIVGPINNDFSLQAIQLNGVIIGYLALPPKTQLTDAFDVAFLEQTKEDLFYIVLVLFILITIIAIPMSRHFVMPIKRLERAMRLLNSGDFKVKINVTGNDELSSLSLNFNDLAKTLEQNESSRNTWLANISHELRTPIAIIKGEIEAIQDGIRPLNFNSLSSLDDEVKHLHKLVNDLSTLSNAEIGAMRYQKKQLNLATVIDHNLMRHQHKANELKLLMSENITNTDITIWADETRINQLIDNLINNSFKYTQAPGTILISLTKEGTQAILTISDSFPSVPDDSMTKLFEHLYRIESSRNRKTGGSGLGLALCKKIMSAHQGTIEAGHSEFGGLEIRCTFPLLP